MSVRNLAGQPSLRENREGWVPPGAWIASVLAMVLVVGMSLWPARGAWAATSRDGVTVGAPSPWVQAWEPQGVLAQDKGVEDGDGPLQYLLFDQQVRASQEMPGTYRNVMVRVAHASGLEDGSHIQVSFNPAYQRLTIHHVRIHRDGKVMQKLDPKAIKVLQRERELEYRILDGSLSANLFLDDVRVGDVIEYGYTITGFNPVFGEQRFGLFDLQWSVPVQQMHHRLLWPKGQPLHMRERNGATVAVRSEVAGFDEYVWSRHQIPALTVESDAPAWYDPYPAVEWGGVKDWAAVVEWALPLYTVPQALGPELRQVAQRMAQTYEKPQDRVAEVLRLVQSQVRYLGVEVGVNSHAPQAPDLVYQRRFGDCKDKALLMVSLLRAMGIEAHPALVHTTQGRMLGQYLPSPARFNHVIVQVRLDGRTWWLDPTRATQYGRLDTLYQPDFVDALVIAPQARDLTSMASDVPRVHKREVFVDIDASGGRQVPARMVVRTQLTGLDADRQREELAQTSRSELQNRYLNFYVSTYPGTTVAAPIEVRDDQEGNRVTLVEHYSVPDIWKSTGESGGVRLSVYSSEINEYIKKSTRVVRQAPLGLSHPIDIQVTTEVRLSDDWHEPAAESRVASDGFEYVGRASWPDPRRFVVSDSYRSLADHVLASKVQEHNKRMQEVQDHVGYYVQTGDGGSDVPATSFNGQVAFIAGLMLLVLVWVAWRIYQWDPPAAAGQGEHGLALGGILYLAALGVYFGPLAMGYQLWQQLPAYRMDTWAELTIPGGASYHGMWSIFLLTELFLLLAQWVMSVLLLILFIRRRTSMPKVWVAVSFFMLAAALIDQVMVALLPADAGVAFTEQEIAEVVRTLLIRLAWCVYFLRSKRVAGTFTQRRQSFGRVHRDEPTSPGVVLENHP